MGYEVDFIAVGEGEKSGDAIALRYGDLNGPRDSQTICVIDGGTLDSGQKLVDHIRTFYKTETIDLVISTHPDIDHACGLKIVLEELDFGTLLMHKPWDHAPYICDLFKSERMTPTGLSDKLEKAISAAHDLQQICDRKGKPIIEPFTGTSTKDGRMLVLGPTKEFYQSLLPHFRSTPTAAMPTPGFLQKAVAKASDVISMIAESLQIETLTDSGTTSAENNSSAIVLFTIDGKKLLFTADAGIPALTAAADYANSRNISLEDLTLLQIPHHGSKRNVGPTILQRIRTQEAYISAGKESAPKHPAKKVTNALIRRNAKVYVTAGKTIMSPYNAPLRSGWEPAPLIPFYDKVEE